jgi:hypothetical protein
MVKSARSKALAKKRQNRSQYLLQRKIKEKSGSRWSIIRSLFHFLILFYRSRTKNVNKDKTCNLLECPVPVRHFLNKNPVLISDGEKITASSDTVDCG